MSESSLREAIARVIFRGSWRDPESEFAEKNWIEFGEWYLDQADAVLAVLADPPDDVIEQAAAAMVHPLVTDRDAFDMASDAFAAVFGGEQDD